MYEMRFHIHRKIMLFFSIMILTVPVCFANNELYKKAKILHRNGQLDEAIYAYKNYLTEPVDEGIDLTMYTDALVQLMNTFQSKGDPEGCISALEQVFESSPTLQNEYLRDFYSVMGYALSRTEKNEAGRRDNSESTDITSSQCNTREIFPRLCIRSCSILQQPGLSE